MALSLGDTTKKVAPGATLSIGNLNKIVPVWTVGLKWDPAPGVSKVDCDLWLVLIGPQGNQALEFVRYNENDPDAVVISPSGSLTYMGDDRDGTSSDTKKRPFDEYGKIDLDKAKAQGGTKVVIVANIYEPKGLTFDQVAEAGIAVWAGEDLMNPTDAVGMSLTAQGQGANTVVFGWVQLGDSTGDVSVQNRPAMSASILEALAPFGIG